MDDFDFLDRARRQVRTRRVLNDIDQHTELYDRNHWSLSLADLSISDRVEQATLDHLEREAETVLTIADREILQGDLIDLAETVRRSGYDDVFLFHPASIRGIPPFDIEAHGWGHGDMALAVAPKALAQPPADLPLHIGRPVETVVDIPPAWTVKHPDGVAVAKRVSTDFEWGGGDE